MIPCVEANVLTVTRPSFKNQKIKYIPDGPTIVSLHMNSGDIELRVNMNGNTDVYFVFSMSYRIISYRNTNP